MSMKVDLMKGTMLENVFIVMFHGRHAHLDDPGRAEWEGFPSGTKAAAAGILLYIYMNLYKEMFLPLTNTKYKLLTCMLHEEARPY